MYNLGSVYVTVFVYKNVALHWKWTGDSPIFIGPMFIHGRSDMDTYSDFFGHIISRTATFRHSLLGPMISWPVAMCKCMEHYFP